MEREDDGDRERRDAEERRAQAACQLSATLKTQPHTCMACKHEHGRERRRRGWRFTLLPSLQTAGRTMEVEVWEGEVPYRQNLFEEREQAGVQAGRC